MLGANRWAIIKCDFEKDNLHHDHEAGLGEKGVAVVCAEPVKYSISSYQLMDQASPRVSLLVLQYRGYKHDERDVEGEAITAFRAVNREDLVGVGCYWRENKTGQTLLASFSDLEKGELTTRARSNG